MKQKIVILLAFVCAVSCIAKAQQFNTDLKEDRLKGPVKSMLTTVRTPAGRIVGHPMRYNYNRSGFYSQNTYYDTMGNPVIINSFSYDKKNRLEKEVRTHEPYSELLSQTTYTYNKKANTITADMFGIADSLGERTVYQFNKKGLLLQTATYDEANKELATISYEYDALDDMRIATYTEGENHIYKGSEKYRYDTEGNLAERCSYYLTTLRQAFLYTYYYDDHGNWTEGYLYHVTPTEGYLYQIISRQISYYDE